MKSTGSWSISRLAKAYGLSRSALLYYDSIGLLSPLERSASGYRLYSERMAERLGRICAYRKAGMPLRDIAALLDGRRAEEDGARALLLKRLEQVNGELLSLRAQRQLLTAMLSGSSPEGSAPLCGRALFVDALKRAGLSKEDMERFHKAFEASSPEAHADFLALLGFKPEEIESLRKAWASNGA